MERGKGFLLVIRFKQIFRMSVLEPTALKKTADWRKKKPQHWQEYIQVAFSQEFYSVRDSFIQFCSEMESNRLTLPIFHLLIVSFVWGPLHINR